MKYCEFADPESIGGDHSHVTEDMIYHSDAFELGEAGSSTSKPAAFSRRELFERTFGLYCALVERGCSYRPDSEDSDVESDSDDEDDGRDPRSRTNRKPSCKGRIVFRRGAYGEPHVQ